MPQSPCSSWGFIHLSCGLCSFCFICLWVVLLSAKGIMLVESVKSSWRHQQTRILSGFSKVGIYWTEGSSAAWGQLRGLWVAQSGWGLPLAFSLRLLAGVSAGNHHSPQSPGGERLTGLTQGPPIEGQTSGTTVSSSCPSSCWGGGAFSGSFTAGVLEHVFYHSHTWVSVSFCFGLAGWRLAMSLFKLMQAGACKILE